MTSPKIPKLLGVSASLRNARWGKGSKELISSLMKIKDQDELSSYLKQESELHLENFLNAGRDEGKEFLEIYQNLKKLSGKKGLSNSEVALASALWAAYQEGLHIDHISLSDYFSPNNEIKNPGELKSKLRDADGIIISGPVYFGDRGSLAESLLDFIARDQELKQYMSGKIYAGIAVGAKRNGGQETTLIYQMLDMVNLGFLAVGNDSDTTSQYGGTCHAGDVGTMWKDKYGLDTSMGTGRRVANVLSMLSTTKAIRDVPRVLFIILENSRELAEKSISVIAEKFVDQMHANVLDMTSSHIRRCIACDICPTHIDVDEEYRCIIKSKADAFSELHEQLLNYDMIVPIVMSMQNRTQISSNYQLFIERTRYLRRGDYVFSDVLITPLSIVEIGQSDLITTRCMTSFLRHHSILSQPIIEYLNNDDVINGKQVEDRFLQTLNHCKKITAGRLASAIKLKHSKYNPVGYVLSTNKDLEDERLNKRVKMIDARNEKLVLEAEERLYSDLESKQNLGSNKVSV